jgi:chaperone required for assembly of F1-ATPase
MTYKAEAPTKKSDQLGFRPARFWKAVAIAETEGGFTVVLDGRGVKTPQGRALVFPTKAVAEQVAVEWEAVGEHVNYEDMPLTRLGFAAIDRMNDLVEESIAEVLRYAETDLVCYPSEYPAALIAREDEAWLPLIAWAKDELGLEFHQNRSLIHRPQPAETPVKLRALIERATSHERAGLMSAIPLFGSVVLALAVWKARLTGEAAFAASRVGETFQAETWGRDAEAVQRAAHMEAQARSLDVWFSALALP